MKMLKRWLAFFVVVVLLIGVAFNGRSPIAASQIDEGNTTEGAAAGPAMEQQGSEEPEAADNSNSESNGDMNGATVQEIEPDTQAGESQPAASTENIDNGTAVYQDALELKQEVKDENGKVICTVTANVQDGTFEADTSEVSMEVAAVEPNISEEVKALMETTIDEGQMLGKYFFYHIIFKINGVPTEPGREVKITFEPKDYQIADVKKARTFYYNEANSIAGNQQAEIIEITQKADKIAELQNAGQSTEHIDDYDLAEIALRDDGSADKIQMEGRRSTIYGCYLKEPKPEDGTMNGGASTEGETKEEETEGKSDISGTAASIEESRTLQYEDANVSVTVSANKEGIIPADSKLKVIPVLPDDKKTKDQYKEVEDKLKDKAKNENYSIAGFLAYDISFVDEDGKEVEPDGNVKVTMEYKKDVIPKEVEVTEKGLGVTVMHLEENEKGQVKKVVDMVADDGSKASVETTDNGKVKKAEFVTDSFSTFTLAWQEYEPLLTDYANGSVRTSDNSLGAPEHNKRIKYNEKDKDYTLTLDVTGKRGKKAGVDVLLVIDKSGSMGLNDNGRTDSNYFNLMPTLKKTVPTLVDTILPDSDSVNRVAAISFSSDDYTGNDISTDWVDYNGKSGFNRKIEGLGTKGGTNWQLAMRNADKKLKPRAESQNKKVVVFLSDGEPTYRYEKRSYYPYEEYETGGGQSYSSANLTNAVDEVAGSDYLKDAEIYSVYLTSQTSTRMTEFANKLTAKNINAHAKDGTNMASALQEIINQIVAPAYQNVVIEDTLSEYVQFHDFDQERKPVITVKKTTADGGTTTLSQSDYTLNYNSLTKKISVSLLHGEALEEGATYSISFDVEPTDAATNYFIEHGEYPHIGDEGTDADGNYTSSGKEGFYSNSTATVKYKENKESLQQTAAYAMPVVQVEKAFCDFSFDKVNSKDNPVAGAKFLLKNDKDPSITYVAVSESDGKVTFKNLRVGEYTLTETAAAKGYVRETAEWKVKVERGKDGSIAAALYQSDGTTLTEGQKIVNYTEKEEAVKNLESDKTASVVNEADRVFQIELSASTKGRDEGIAAQAASIVLVLDASASMQENGKKLKDIQDAAKAFVNTTKEKSPISEIAVIWYQGSEGSSSTITDSGFYTLDTSDNVDAINRFISNKNASGGTPMGDALEEANSILSGRPNSSKYALLFTDGMPGYNSSNNSFNCMVANHANNEAKEIKEYAKLYTIGYKLSGSFKWEEGHSQDSTNNHGSHKTETKAADFLKNYLASSPEGDRTYAYTTDNTDGLTKIFEDIAGQIGDLYKINPEKIVDVIDARFELTEESKKKLEAMDGVTVEVNQNGTTTITWTKDAAVIGNAESTDPDNQPWSASFQVKAKDDFIGGNMVPTNGAASGIYISEDSTKLFPQPSVNVRLLSLDMEDKEITVYKGDSIKPEGFADELADTLKILELDQKTVTDTGKPSYPELTESQKAELQEKGTITLGEDQSVEYVYPNTDEAVGYFVHTYKLSENPGGNMAEHVVDTAGDRVEVYELNVQFIPYATSEREAMPELEGVLPPTQTGGTELNPDPDRLIAQGEYVVNVIAGELQITKKLTETSDKDQTFIFTIKKDGLIYKTVTLTVPANATQATYTGEDLSDLARGEYLVTETLSDGYAVKEFSIGEGTNCKSSRNESEETATFTMGLNKAGKDVIAEADYESGILGQAIYTNEKVIKDWNIKKVSSSDPKLVLANAQFKLQSTTGSTAYYGKSDKNGIVKWYVNEDCTQALAGKIAADMYQLSEMKAPDGYAVSTDIWMVEVTKNGALKTITSDGKVIEGNREEGTTTIFFQFENDPVYALPKAGGPGIFWYTAGGTLLMILAGMLALYKNKKNEAVLRN